MRGLPAALLGAGLSLLAPSAGADSTVAGSCGPGHFDPNGFAGSPMVSSCSDIVAVVNGATTGPKNDTQFGYGASSTSDGDSLFLPLVRHSSFPSNPTFAVQNLSSSGDTDVTITFSQQSEIATGPGGSASLGGGSVVRFPVMVQNLGTAPRATP